MGYNIPIMSGLRVPNEEEIANLSEEERDKLGKLYLLHSKNVEVDCQTIVDGQVTKTYADLGNVLGQLAKTTGSVHWNANGLNDVEPDSRLYPELNIEGDIQSILAQQNIPGMVSSAVTSVLENQVQEKVDALQQQLDTIDGKIEATTTTASTLEERITDASISIAQIEDKVSTAQTDIETLNTDVDNLQHKINSLFNYNYLDNSNFMDPINQREQDYYEGENYTIDRWKGINSSATVTIQNNYITIEEGIKQIIKKPVAVEQFTLAATKQDNIIDLLQFTGTTVQSDNLKIEEIEQDGDICLEISLFSGNWKNIGLYEGEKTSDTWEYVPKSYNDELTNCLRYFYRYNGQAMILLPLFQQLEIYCTLPQSMRCNPTVVVSHLSNISFNSSKLGIVAPDRGDGKPDMAKSRHDINLIDVLHISDPIAEIMNTNSPFGQFVFRLTHTEQDYPTISYEVNTSGDNNPVLETVQGQVWYYVVNQSYYLVPLTQWCTQAGSQPAINTNTTGSCRIKIDLIADY